MRSLLISQSSFYKDWCWGKSNAWGKSSISKYLEESSSISNKCETLLPVFFNMLMSINLPNEKKTLILHCGAANQIFWTIYFKEHDFSFYKSEKPV